MNKNVLLAFLGGVVAGGFAALLLAPRSGEEFVNISLRNSKAV